MTNHNPITYFDLECPDEDLQKILANIVCCTDCGFGAKIIDDHLIIKYKDKEFDISLEKYTKDIHVISFSLSDDNKNLQIKLNNGSLLKVKLVDIINQSIFVGKHITSGTGLQTEIVIYHNLDFTPEHIFLEALSFDAKDYTHITVDSKKIVVWYQLAPQIGQNNLSYNYLIRV